MILTALLDFVRESEVIAPRFFSPKRFQVCTVLFLRAQHNFHFASGSKLFLYFEFNHLLTVIPISKNYIIT